MDSRSRVLIRQRRAFSAADKIAARRGVPLNRLASELGVTIMTLYNWRMGHTRSNKILAQRYRDLCASLPPALTTEVSDGGITRERARRKAGAGKS